jgi:hypothetical protein
MTALQITAAALVALLAVVGLVFLAVVAWGFLAGLVGRRRRRPEDQLVDELKRQAGRGRCRVCGCTDDDCSQCIAKTGFPCYWVEPDLCSACAIAITENLEVAL